jgi:Flp pilus assembly protein TadB
MTDKEPARSDLVALSAFAVATCCTLSVLAGVAGALGVGLVFGAWVLLAAGAFAAVLFGRWLRGTRKPEV